LWVCYYASGSSWIVKLTLQLTLQLAASKVHSSENKVKWRRIHLCKRASRSKLQRSRRKIESEYQEFPVTGERSYEKQGSHTKTFLPGWTWTSGGGANSSARSRCPGDCALAPAAEAGVRNRLKEFLDLRAHVTKGWSQNWYRGFLINSMKVIRRPHG
jgi:hypothetical protein